jgi:Ser-tRNA(Ala) deacylase AlaX
MDEIISNKDYDPRMHSAEHILNQTMVRMFKCERSFSNHIEKKKSKCDYHFERNLTAEEMSEIESRVNAVIKSDSLITEEFVEREKVKSIFNLERLPQTAGEVIRIIKIGDYDSCPCSGMHVKSTDEIGQFKIISSSYENGVMRLRFKLLNH